MVTYDKEIKDVEERIRSLRDRLSGGFLWEGDYEKVEHEIAGLEGRLMALRSLREIANARSRRGSMSSDRRVNIRSTLRNDRLRRERTEEHLNASRAAIEAKFTMPHGSKGSAQNS